VPGLFRTRRRWRPRPLRNRYDVVIVGGGLHGLATAYYLGERGVRDVAVFEKSYLGAGASGRTTAIVRATERPPEGAALDDESLRLYEALGARLRSRGLFRRQGHLTLAHTDGALVRLRSQAEVDQLAGGGRRLIGREELGRRVPALDVSPAARHPILAALYDPRGGTVRHDAVVWGYARGADRAGVHLHPFTEVTGIDVADGRVSGVRTTRGDVKTGVVLNATAGLGSTVARMAGCPLPLTTHPCQALVTEPLAPFLDTVVVSADLHVSVSQAGRGGCVIGSEVDPYASYSQRSTLPFLEATAQRALLLFPGLRQVRVLRQWTGLCDVTPDDAPIVGEVPGIRGFYLDVGWGTSGFTAGPGVGRRLAELLATGRTPEPIKPFSIARFGDDRLRSREVPG
jgi:sarcosine oxidase subunit beta